MPDMGVRLSFPPFTFDRDERVLRRDGTTVPLAPKVAEALGLLLADPGALVEKNALRDALWPEGFVEDGNLTQTIYLIRRALDPDGDGRAFVETIPRRGYRFVAPVVREVALPAARRTIFSHAGFALRAAAAAFAIVVLSGGVSIGRSWSSTPAELTGEAARAYTVGRYNWNRRNESAVRTAIADFSRVVALVPNDARGYAGLADAYVTVGDWEYGRIAPRDVAFRKADEYAQEALRRDPAAARSSAGVRVSRRGAAVPRRCGRCARVAAPRDRARPAQPDRPRVVRQSAVLRTPFRRGAQRIPPAARARRRQQGCAHHARAERGRARAFRRGAAAGRHVAPAGGKAPLPRDVLGAHRSARRAHAARDSESEPARRRSRRHDDGIGTVLRARPA